MFIDDKSEFGFKRNNEIQIHDANYWIDGYKFLFKSLTYLQGLPLFMRVLLINSFKLCKYIQIIRLFNTSEFNIKCNLNENFQQNFEELFPFLKKNPNTATKELNVKGSSITYNNLLELNFKIIKLNESKLEDMKSDEITIETLFNKHFEDEKIYNLNIELEIDKFITNSFNQINELVSNVLMNNLISNYHLFTFIEQLHSYSLFKTNEHMFLFSKNLFELIKFYETYQDEMVLNKILYHSSSNLFTASKETMNYQKLFKIVYENNPNVCQIINKNSPARQRGVNISTRLVSGIKLKFYLNWPFNLIIKEADIEVYNKFFILILQMKQVKYDLDSLDFKGMKKNNNLDERNFFLNKKTFNQIQFNKKKIINFQI